MKRTPLRKVSDRGRLIKEAEKLLRQILKDKRGNKCEVCGRKPADLGLAHILPKGKYPSLRLYPENILLLCWMPCHYFWHHDRDDARAKRVEAKIIKKLGADWLDTLRVKAKLMPRLTEFQICLYIYAFKQETKEVVTAYENRPK